MLNASAFGKSPATCRAYSAWIALLMYAKMAGSSPERSMSAGSATKPAQSRRAEAELPQRLDLLQALQLGGAVLAMTRLGVLERLKQADLVSLHPHVT